MLNQKKYNFEIIFEKIEETKKNGECCNNVDMDIFEEVNSDIRELEEYTKLFKESEYHIYTRT